MIIGTKSKLGRSLGANPLGSGCPARHCILLRHNCHNLKGLFSAFFAFYNFMALRRRLENLARDFNQG
jgi:hypothetical protein